MENKSFFSSWSGGKDSSLALYKQLKRGGDLKLLFSVFRGNGEKSGSHGLKREIISLQSQSIGVNYSIGVADWGEYEHTLLEFIEYAESIGIRYAVFGDIDLLSHRDWIESVLSKTGVEPLFPLWGMDREEVVREFIDSGFEAIVVACNTESLPEQYLGKKLDHDLIDELKAKGIDVAGENGEYHTLVIGGPIFKERIDIKIGDIYSVGKNSFLDIST